MGVHVWAAPNGSTETIPATCPHKYLPILSADKLLPLRSPYTITLFLVTRGRSETQKTKHLLQPEPKHKTQNLVSELALGILEGSGHCPGGFLPLASVGAVLVVGCVKAAKSDFKVILLTSRWITHG